MDIRNIKRKTAKIFGIGLPRTGTTSLCAALGILGYKALHNPLDFRKRQYQGKLDFHGDWDALTNFGEHIYPQLDGFYPNSKFILTYRDKEKWLKSMKWLHQEKKDREIANKIRIETFGCQKFHHEIYSHVYDLHYKNALDYFNDRECDLLIVNWEKGDGWKELCGFLGKDMPTVPFPHKNKKEDTVIDVYIKDGQKVSKWVR